ncbi:MAG: hypothetical protein A2W99_07210 [Bacteroidetes bacterium GWF2_33_16]|nr:MAG: hypothetical protein A2X00_11990 [Bacteroidetes bacterium GWE2_32_14]OFY03181.1 MAG: hypothetical protein A2W99_07210 [Bacteroidetes bacterium GWF2_33_16]
MKAVSVKELKEELRNRSQKELLELCLRLSVFKKENKELLTYLLFESYDETLYIESVKKEIDEQFLQINKKTYYLMKKSIRKILTNIKKFIRYSQKKETEVELLLYFCTKLKNITPSYKRSPRLINLYNGQLDLITKKISSLHEDLQYDFGIELKTLIN